MYINEQIPPNLGVKIRANLKKIALSSAQNLLLTNKICS
jgi:hypothetical protein